MSSEWEAFYTLKGRSWICGQVLRSHPLCWTVLSQGPPFPLGHLSSFLIPRVLYTGILKSRVIILLTKIHIVKSMAFLVVMYGCESWTIKEAECWRIDAFKLWWWRRLLRGPCTARRSSQSILKEISPKYSLGKTDAEAEAPILWPPDVKSWFIGKNNPDTEAQILWPPDVKSSLILERMKAGGKGDDRGWDSWMASLAQWTWVWAKSERED